MMPLSPTNGLLTYSLSLGPAGLLGGYHSGLHTVASDFRPFRARAEIIIKHCFEEGEPVSGMFGMLQDAVGYEADTSKKRALLQLALRFRTFRRAPFFEGFEKAMEKIPATEPDPVRYALENRKRIEMAEKMISPQFYFSGVALLACQMICELFPFSVEANFAWGAKLATLSAAHQISGEEAKAARLLAKAVAVWERQESSPEQAFLVRRLRGS